VVEKINPGLYIFSHIHEGYGITLNGKITFINASTCDQLYQPVNQPMDYDFKA